jgi:hypothetical protein
MNEFALAIIESHCVGFRADVTSIETLSTIGLTWDIGLGRETRMGISQLPIILRLLSYCHCLFQIG